MAMARVFDRDLQKDETFYPNIIRGKGNYLFSKDRPRIVDRIFTKGRPRIVDRIFTKDRTQIFDASGGAAVSCLGHGNKRVLKAINKQLKSGISYLESSHFRNETVDKAIDELVNGADMDGAMGFLTNGGSVAMEAAVKLARQYYIEKEGKATARQNYITRRSSYHGNTVFTLGLSGFESRKEIYRDLQNPVCVHHISACYPYRQRYDGESDEQFVGRKAEELDKKFKQLGPKTVIGFIAEPVVGAALGCVPAVPGYLKAMRDVCHKHGALFILDEVMCGMGRTGTLHAWQGENISPDLEIVAKGLGAGFQSAGAVLISKKVADVVKEGSGQFIHGYTYQHMPIEAAAIRKVQQIIREDNLLNNVTKQGAFLEKELKAALGNHPNVGDIRGRGLFWGIEFVKDKKTKLSFRPELKVAHKLQALAMSQHNIYFYSSPGSRDSENGDNIIIAPQFQITEKDVKFIVKTVNDVVNSFFTGFIEQ